MGADSGQTNGAGQDMNDIIVIDTEGVESCAAKLLETYASTRDAYKPIPGARETLRTVSGASAINNTLHKLYDAESSFYKHMGELETGGQMLRNIAIAYDNTEKQLIGESVRELIDPAEPSKIGPFVPGETKGDDGGNGDGGSRQDDSKQDDSKGNDSKDSGSKGDGSKEEIKIEESSNSGSKWKWDKRQWENGDSPWDAASEHIPFDKYGKLCIGQKKKINEPDGGIGGYVSQSVLTWAGGVTLLQGNVKKEDPFKYYDYDNEQWAQKHMKNLGKKGDKPFAPQKVGTYCEAYVETSATWTAAGLQAKKIEDTYKYTAELYAARGEAKAHAGVGAYCFKMPDGSYATGYGLNCSAGASFTVGGAAASGDLGWDVLGVVGGASAAVGQVYANANTMVGMVDGKFYATASGAVGADLFNAQASLGGRVLGMEVSGSASFKVGLSAKFEVGFEGSKFKCNIGAALGIGIELNINIDFSKVASAVKTVGKAIGQAWRAIWRRW